MPKVGVWVISVYSACLTIQIDYVPSLGDWKIAWDFILALITKHNPAGFFCPNFGCLQKC